MGKVSWTQDELALLEKMYSEYTPMKEMSEALPNHTKWGISSKALSLGLSKKYVKPNSANFKAIYQDYDWCFERYVNRGMSIDEMAKEAGCTKRVMQKWMDEKHRIHEWTFKELKKLSPIQKEIITIGTIGDGHIDRRIDQPMYIETHADNEKDYMFWKYSFLKDICAKPPVRVAEKESKFPNGRSYLCRAQWRLSSRIVWDLKPIREMSRYDKLKTVTEFQLCLLMLDDGSRSNLWELCVAAWNESEIDLFINLCASKFNLVCNRIKDVRYVHFDAISSKRIDDLILKYIPNDLDIVKKKITNNSKIRELANYRYVVSDDFKIGISTYCKKNKIDYESVRDFIVANNIDKAEFTEEEILKIAQGVCDVAV